MARKYPDDDVRVTILQSGPTVTLRIETPEGDIEEIERTLEQYGLVVTGQLAIDRFTDDRELIRDLRTRIEVTNLELKLRKEAFLDQKAQYEERVVSLEDQVQNLYSLVSTGLDHSTSLGAVIGSVASMGTCNARAAQSLETIARLMAQAQVPQNKAALSDAFATIRRNIDLIKTEGDSDSSDTIESIMFRLSYLVNGLSNSEQLDKFMHILKRLFPVTAMRSYPAEATHLVEVMKRFLEKPNITEMLQRP